MRTFFIIIALSFAICLAYLGYAHFTGGSVPSFGLPLGGERAHVRARTLSFFEHVKFKNASALHDFMESGSTPAEISSYLHKSLGINTDTIDLNDVTIEHVELNSAETRARARVNFSGQNLGDKKPFAFSKILFLYKNVDGKWLVDTNSVAP